MRTIIDFTGQKFGKLTVLGRGKDHIFPSGQKHPKWKVKCNQCKEEYEIDKEAFLKNKNQNCNLHSKLYKDLTGQKFGKLIVLRKGKDYVYANGNKRISQWKVKCEDCKIEYDLKKELFLTKKNKTCTKHTNNFINLTGQKFGKLIVLHKTKNHIYPSGCKCISWKVKCGCGEEYDITTNSLLKNEIKSCKKCIQKLSDLTGQKFGKLTVIGRAKNYISPAGYKSSRWKVKCKECKIEYELKKTSFLKKKNQNCNQHNHRYTDLTGQKFGKLTILGISKNSLYKNKKEVYWEVECGECGTKYDAIKNNLLKKKNKVCSNCTILHKDLTGKKFGKLTVIKIDDKEHVTKGGRKQLYWLCKCKCGTSVSVLGEHLYLNKTTKCKKCKYKSMQLNGYISSSLFCRIKWNAKIRNIYFDKTIDREYLWNLYLKQNKKCVLSNLPIYFAKNMKKETFYKETTASLDRINNSKGYIKSNIQWVHKDINKIKYIYSNKKFIKLCKKIWTNQINKKIILTKKYYKKEYTINSQLWGAITYGAKIRKIHLSSQITKKYLYELYLKQNRKCALSGTNIYLAKKYSNRSKNTASLDRINSSKGYTKENIQWVHKKINIIKWAFSQKYFIEMCNLVAKNNK